MAIGSEMVNAEVYDWDEFRSYSSTHKVSAVPKTFINYGESFVGTETETSILDRVQKNGR
jgi:hypothetical protein